MLLDNFYQIARCKFGLALNNTYKFYSIDSSVRGLYANDLGKGLITTPTKSTEYINYPGSSGSTIAYPMVVLSTDTTEPKRTDYKMDGVLTTDDLELYSPTFGYSYTNMANYSITAKNNTAENITVNKVGLMSAYVYSNVNYSTLVYEELLSEPVTLAPNDIYTFTVQIG